MSEFPEDVQRTAAKYPEVERAVKARKDSQ
jgi:hypothetical protein